MRKSPCQKLYLIVQTLYFESSAHAVLLQSFNEVLREVLKAAQPGEVFGAGREQARRGPVLRCLEGPSAITYEAELISHAE